MLKVVLLNHNENMTGLNVRHSEFAEVLRMCAFTDTDLQETLGFSINTVLPEEKLI